MHPQAFLCTLPVCCFALPAGEISPCRADLLESELPEELIRIGLPASSSASLADLLVHALGQRWAPADDECAVRPLMATYGLLHFDPFELDVLVWR